MPWTDWASSAVAQGILPVVPGVKAVGEAFTVNYRPCGVVKGTVGDFLDDVAPGQVVVLDNGGRTYGTVWGDIMTVYAQKRGVAGTVIDGVCRDLPRILDVRYPIFTRGRFMVTGKDRVELDGLNVPVSVSDVQVRPGDISGLRRHGRGGCPCRQGGRGIGGGQRDRRGGAADTGPPR